MKNPTTKNSNTRTIIMNIVNSPWVIDKTKNNAPDEDYDVIYQNVKKLIAFKRNDPKGKEQFKHICSMVEETIKK